MNKMVPCALYNAGSDARLAQDMVIWRDIVKALPVPLTSSVLFGLPLRSLYDLKVGNDGRACGCHNNNYFVHNNCAQKCD